MESFHDLRSFLEYVEKTKTAKNFIALTTQEPLNDELANRFFANTIQVQLSYH